jgi:hypothetical protein
MLMASIEGYNDAVAQDFGGLVEDQSLDRVRAFARSLVVTNRSNMASAYYAGYTDAGGAGELDREEIDSVVAWNNSYVQNLERDMAEALEEGGDLASFADRVMQYPAQGWKMAYMAGVFQAKGEQGYNGWQRVLGPDPCDWCAADAGRIHLLTEGFIDHPNGECSVMYVTFWRGGQAGVPMRIPELPMPVPYVEVT